MDFLIDCLITALTVKKCVITGLPGGLIENGVRKTESSWCRPSIQSRFRVITIAGQRAGITGRSSIFQPVVQSAKKFVPVSRVR